MMTSAELKTLRESLGLTAQWLANNAGVRLRTLQYWESGRVPVPADVADLLVALDLRYTCAAQQAVDVAQQITHEHGKPETVALFRYKDEASLWADRPDMQGLPLAAHAALLARTRLSLIAAGFAVRIEYKSGQISDVG